MSQVTIQVDGMSCSHCVNAVEGALKKLPGVNAASVSLDNDNVAVEYEEGQVSLEKMKEAIEDQGYDVK